MPRVAITGASGFVGRHVTAALLARGADVVVTTHHSPPPSSAVEQVAMDIASPGDDPFAALGRPDVLLHLAWSGLPNYRASHHVDVELPRHKRFLHACIAGGLKRLAITGTCLEYGMIEGELDETAPPAAVTAYGEAKRSLSEWLSRACADADVALVWMRLFYLYGEGQAPTSLYAQLQRAVAAGDTTFPMSPANQQRDFLPVRAAAAIISDLALGNGTGVINVCSGKASTVRDMARQWLREWDADIALDRGVFPYPDYEPFAFWGSVGKLHATLGST